MLAYLNYPISSTESNRTPGALVSQNSMDHFKNLHFKLLRTYSHFLLSKIAAYFSITQLPGNTQYLLKHLCPFRPTNVCNQTQLKKGDLYMHLAQ